MKTLNSRLQLALLNRKKGRNLLEKGFTLVELMIVIVIVGILSSVALPTFLSQRDKAKGTECVTKLGALITTINTEAISGNLTPAQVKTVMDAEATAAGTNSICNYAIGTAPSAADGTWTATATGNDTGLPDENIWNGCIAVTTGKKDVVKSPATASCA
jgi:type IV pilus assembly protein PilA